MPPFVELLGYAAIAAAGAGVLAAQVRLDARRHAAAARRIEERWREAMDLLADRRTHEAALVLERIVDARERDLGPFAPELAGWLYHLAVVQGMLGRDDEVEALLERSLVLLRRDRRRAEGVTEGDVLLSLAMTALRRGRYEAARSGLARARVHYGAEPAVEPHAEALLEEGLGLVAEHDGDHAEAERRYRAALARLESAPAGEPVSRGRSPYRAAPARAAPDRAPTYVARLLERIGRLAHARSDLTEAEDVYRRALGIIEEREGESAPDLASILIGLSAVHLGSERPAGALREAERALAIARAAGDLERELDAMEGIADARAALRRADAKEALDAVIARVTSALGASHPRLVRLLLRDGLGSELAGRREVAEERFLRAREIAERAGDPRRLALAENSLAASLSARSALGEAAACAERALALFEVDAEAEEPILDVEIALCVDTMAEIRRRQGRLPEARRLMNRALSGVSAALGPDSSYAAIVRAGDAKLLWSEGRREDARAAHDSARETLARLHGDGDAMTRRMVEEWQEAIAEIGAAT